MNLAHTQFQSLKHMLRTVQAEGLETFFSKIEQMGGMPARKQRQQRQDMRQAQNGKHLKT